MNAATPKQIAFVLHGSARLLRGRVVGKEHVRAMVAFHTNDWPRFELVTGCDHRGGCSHRPGRDASRAAIAPPRASRLNVAIVV